MHLANIGVNQFRIYEQLDLDIPVQGMRLVGRNASGKTSLLEAMVMLATTRSPRTSTERDTIRWESGVEYGIRPYARLTGTVESERGVRNLELSLESTSDHTATTRKKFVLDGRSVRAHTFVGTLRVVLFGPEDVHLVTGAPTERRRLLDILLSQIDHGYMRALGSYAKLLTQRNGLLRQFARDGVAPTDRQAVAQLSFWDERLIREGSSVLASRILAVRDLSASMSKRSWAMIDGKQVALDFHPGIDLHRLDSIARADADGLTRSIAPLFENALGQKRAEEFRRGVTLMGPQRDDFSMMLDNRSMAAYSSRGQQRLGIVALKLSEADVIRDRTDERPVVLLDDVLSELDVRHRDLLLESLAAEEGQLIVTSATEDSLQHPALDHLPVVSIDRSGRPGSASG